MKLSYILAIMITTICIYALFYGLKNINIKEESKMNDNYFIIRYPKLYLDAGIVCLVGFLMFMLGFTFFSTQEPHVFYYIMISVLICMSIYSIVETIKVKVVVHNNNITVYPIVGKPYSFSFEEITSVRRITTKGKTKFEWLIIKTSNKKKLKVEMGQSSHNRIKKRIKSDVDNKLLIGFQN